MLRTAEIELTGWGRYQRERSRAVRLERRRDPQAAIEQLDGPCLSRGLGRSYGDAAYDPRANVLLHQRLDRIIRFDAESATLECEAGLSLHRLNQVFVPRGYFPMVTPGTRHVTIGGCIAADVHGKNHHQIGAFSRCVDAFDLITADGQVRTCSREENRELFEATIGGMGLTGTIHTVRLRLKPIRSSRMSSDFQRAANLAQAFEMFAGDADYPYSVAWIEYG